MLDGGGDEDGTEEPSASGAQELAAPSRDGLGRSRRGGRGGISSPAGAGPSSWRGGLGALSPDAAELHRWQVLRRYPSAPSSTPEEPLCRGPQSALQIPSCAALARPRRLRRRALHPPLPHPSCAASSFSVVHRSGARALSLTIPLSVTALRGDNCEEASYCQLSF